MNLGGLLLGLFLALLLLRVPVAAALGAAAVGVIALGGLGLQVVSFNFQAGIAKFPLLAIPFFILAGVVMDRAGIAERIVRLLLALVGGWRPGAALATVLAGMLWGAISGSGPATVAALGGILVPMMVRQGYAPGFAAGLMAASAELSIIIPPSIALIVYATLAGTSVAQQFWAGILPGVVMGGFLALAAVLVVRARGWGTGEVVPESRWRLLAEAFPGLLTPVIILGGIYGGVFTPTEAAAVGVFWGLLVGMAFYRSLHLGDLRDLLVEAGVSSAVIMAIVAWAGLFAWAADTVGLVGKVTAILLRLQENPLLLLGLLNLFWLVMGMLLDAVSIYYLTLPVLLPVMAHVGWDPVWMGIVMTVNMAIGQITPPVAVNLFVSARVSGLPIERIWREIWPFVLASVLGLLLLAYGPYLAETWGR
ncbi:C4-dicarboxylate TRAP transporter large permease protein DctM (plasmid) [Thermus thermophilus]|uniref:C4-dicarboxylate TRAP transporter large permease protein DctM n=1 Tax=Thermus thermophilus TaxID=274 RepID=A0A3P4AVS0_THETH|nr:TRAP transporter large permease [Thermus thermophilus]VCU54709.1 C4-dicarboxylate TRAP transporter large permease protein DctM [Thermus thermophilus]